MILTENGIVIVNQGPTTAALGLPSDNDISQTDIAMKHPFLVRVAVPYKGH
jgi:hypothetical protein